MSDQTLSQFELSVAFELKHNLGMV